MPPVPAIGFCWVSGMDSGIFCLSGWVWATRIAQNIERDCSQLNLDLVHQLNQPKSLSIPARVVTLKKNHSGLFMSSRKQINNVFEAILEYGHDEDFVPNEGEQFIPTDAPAGSAEKIEACLLYTSPSPRDS